MRFTSAKHIYYCRQQSSLKCTSYKEMYYKQLYDFMGVWGHALHTLWTSTHSNLVQFMQKNYRLKQSAVTMTPVKRRKGENSPVIFSRVKFLVIINIYSWFSDILMMKWNFTCAEYGKRNWKTAVRYLLFATSVSQITGWKLYEHNDVWDRISWNRIPLEIVTWFQRTTNRKCPMPSRIVCDRDRDRWRQHQVDINDKVL